MNTDLAWLDRPWHLCVITVCPLDSLAAPQLHDTFLKFCFITGLASSFVMQFQLDGLKFLPEASHLTMFPMNMAVLAPEMTASSWYQDFQFFFHAYHAFFHTSRPQMLTTLAE